MGSLGVSKYYASWGCCDDLVLTLKGVHMRVYAQRLFDRISVMAMMKVNRFKHILTSAKSYVQHTSKEHTFVRIIRVRYWILFLHTFNSELLDHPWSRGLSPNFPLLVPTLDLWFIAHGWSHTTARQHASDFVNVCSRAFRQTKTAQSVSSGNYPIL